MAGAALFWSPLVVTMAIRRESYSGPDVLLITLIIPVTTVAAFFVLRKRVETLSATWIGVSMVLGIWIAGPLVMEIIHVFDGGSLDLRMAVIATALFPVFTFIYSTYAGTLLALLITTPMLLLLGARKNGAAAVYP